MTARKLLARTMLLFLLTCVLIPTHIALDEDVTWLSEWFAPKYEVPSRDDALEIGDAAHTQDVEKSQELIDEWEACRERNGEIYARIICRARPDEIGPATIDKLVTTGAAIHRAGFVYDEIAPREVESRNLLTYTFGGLYVCITLAVLGMVIRWFRDNQLQRVRSAANKLRELTPNAVELKGALNKKLSSRRLRQLEREFNSLKNLHSNGMIDDLAFEKRKTALKRELEENEEGRDVASGARPGPRSEQS
ncbi:hypothetical protein ABIB42_000299 [Massilia sp. UYP32]